jgi:hypothetical protein
LVGYMPIHITNLSLEEAEILKTHLWKNNVIYRMLPTAAHARCSCRPCKSEHHNMLILEIISSSSSFVTSYTLIGLLRPRILVSSKVFEVVFVLLFQFSIIFGILLLVILVQCRSQLFMRQNRKFSRSWQSSSETCVKAMPTCVLLGSNMVWSSSKGKYVIQTGSV